MTNVTYIHRQPRAAEVQSKALDHSTAINTDIAATKVPSLLDWANEDLKRARILRAAIKSYPEVLDNPCTHQLCDILQEGAETLKPSQTNASMLYLHHRQSRLNNALWKKIKDQDPGWARVATIRPTNNLVHCSDLWRCNPNSFLNTSDLGLHHMTYPGDLYAVVRLEYDQLRYGWRFRYRLLATSYAPDGFFALKAARGWQGRRTEIDEIDPGLTPREQFMAMDMFGVWDPLWHATVVTRGDKPAGKVMAAGNPVIPELEYATWLLWADQEEIHDKMLSVTL